MNRTSVTVCMTNGARLKGIIRGYDLHTVILEGHGKQQCLFKHAISTVQGTAFFRDKRKVDGFIDFSKQVILGNKVFYVDCFGLKFSGWVRPEHIKTFLRNCFIPNSTKKAVDKEGSTASRGRSLSISVINISFPQLDLKPRCH